MPDIRGEPDFEVAAMKRGADHKKMREGLRTNKPRPTLEVGDIVLKMEEVVRETLVEGMEYLFIQTE